MEERAEMLLNWARRICCWPRAPASDRPTSDPRELLEGGYLWMPGLGDCVGSMENGVGKQWQAEKWFSLYFQKMEENRTFGETREQPALKYQGPQTQG